jgi:hypothetical protein
VRAVRALWIGDIRVSYGLQGRFAVVGQQLKTGPPLIACRLLSLTLWRKNAVD